MTVRVIVLGILLFLAGAALGAGADQDSALEQRVAALSAELRCLVCQNQSLADSHAELAIDLKNQVREMMVRGLTDDQIKEYLTQRYGDFVLYRPPVRASTWLLWAGPFLLLVAGVYGLVRVMAARRARPEISGVDLDQAERERARDLLAGSDRRGG